jgi:nitrogen fixation protein FixH
VVTVNLYMARMASSTFGGVVVENSYVASQNYNKWLSEARQSAFLGWNATATRQADGKVLVSLDGADGTQPIVAASARHPLGRLADQTLRFTRLGQGRYVSAEPLAPGRWRLRIEAVAGEQRWRQELEVR